MSFVKISIVCWIFLTTQWVQAQSFLTYSDFIQLTPQKQAQYISTVRELVLQLEKNPHLVAETQSVQRNSLLLIESFINQAQASALSELCQVSNAEQLSNEDLLSKIEQLMNCSEKSGPGQPNYFMSVVPGSMANLSSEYMKRIENGALNRNSNRVREANGIFLAVVSDIRKGTILGGGNFKAEEQVISNNIQRSENLFNAKRQNKLQYTVKTQVEDRSQSTAKSRLEDRSRSTAKSRLETQSRSTAKSESITLPQSPRKNLDRDQDSELLCLYAGFVISKKEHSRCQYMSHLPGNFDSQFFDSETFKCAGSQPVLCHPLLFGFKSVCQKDEIQPCYQKKPLCLSRSSQATKNCFELAKKEDTLSKVEDVWKSPNGETLYQQYTNSLKSLCDKNNIEKRNLKLRAKKDIQDTCKTAFEVFNDHVERKFLPQTLQDRTDSQMQK